MSSRVTMPVIADVRPGNTRYFVDNRELALTAAAVPVPTVEGSLVISDATLKYIELLHPGAAGYALVTDGSTANWSQTPPWTGRHSFAAGIAMTGASSANDLVVPDNTQKAFELEDAGGLEYLTLDTRNAQPVIDFNLGGLDVDFNVAASGVPNALHVSGFDGEIILGALGSGLVLSTAGVLSIATSADTPPAPVAVGDTLVATAGPVWDILTTPGAAGYARVSTATTEVWSQTPTMTGDWTWTSAVSLRPKLTLENTNSNALAPIIDFYKNSISPADDDDLGEVRFSGKSSTDVTHRYARIVAESLDVTQNDIGGGLKFIVAMNQTERSLLELSGYNGAVNQGKVVVNQEGQDVDFIVEAFGVASALTVQGSDGHVGILTAPSATHALLVVSVGQTAAIAGSETTGVAVGGTSVDGNGAAFGSTNAHGIFGTTAGAAAINGVFGEASVAGRGVYGLAVSGVGVQGDSATGIGLVANLTGAGIIAEFRDNGTPVLTVQDGGNVEMSDSILFINETTNANMTIGLTIDQAANDDEAMNFRSDIGAVHSSVETGTYFTVEKVSGSAGGALLRGFRDAAGGNREAFDIRGYLAEAPNTTKTTAARAIIELTAWQTDGTSIVNTVANGNLLALRTFRGGANLTVSFWDEDGDYYYNGALNSYDHLEDGAMARDLQRVLTGRRGVHYNEDAMIEAGILHPSEHGVMVSHKRITALQLGAHAQAYEDRRGLEARIEYLEAQLEKVQ